MTNKEIVTASFVVGGLIGLGLLTFYILKEDKEDKPQQDKEPKKQAKTTSPVAQVNREPKLVKSATKDPLTFADQSKSSGVKSTPVLKVVKPQLEVTPSSHDRIDSNETPVITHAEELEVVDEQHQPPVGDEFPLRLGSIGDRVERLQVWLMRNYGLFGKITKEFDQKTAELVKKYLKMDQLDERTFNRFRMGNHVTGQVIVR